MQSLGASLGSGECVSRAQIWRILRPQRTLEALSAHSNAERGFVGASAAASVFPGRRFGGGFSAHSAHSKPSAHTRTPTEPRHFTQGMPSEVIRVRSEGVGSFVPVPVAATVVTGAAAVVVGDVDV